MNGIGSAQAYSARVQPVMDRIVARRLEHAANETAEAPRREGAAQTAQSPAAIQSKKSALTAAAQSFSKENAFSGRLIEQNLSDASRTQPDGVVKEGKSVLQSVQAAPAAEGSKSTASIELSDEEKAAVDQLKARDREVRSHEGAHKAVGGRYAGAISFEYQKGPDGQRYAVGGEVAIDVSPEDEPEATIQKMNTVIAAALAPAEPSGQDKAVAQAAQALRNQALIEARAQNRTEQNALREGGDAGAEEDAAPNAAVAAATAQNNIIDLLRAAIDGPPESRLSKVA